MDPGARAIDRLYREESGRILATMIRLVGRFDEAEEIVHDAFEAAVEQWAADGTPPNPAAWLFATARNKAIDRVRRAARYADKQRELAAIARAAGVDPLDEAEPVHDDRLRLVFTCCHPALAIEAQVALTLRTLCGMSTEEIARAFLVATPTMAQRLVRAKAKIEAARIPYRVPSADELPERLSAVLAVVYLVFNEGYAATAGDAIVRRDLCAEAIRLARLLGELLPDEAEPKALLALAVLHDARRDARTTAEGEIVLLEEQDRSLWDRTQIAEGLGLVDAALRAGGASRYALQAAIAALHARAPRADDTDWRQIAALYALHAERFPSPVVALNQAVAVAMAEGAERGLALLDALEERGELAGYHLLPAARADLLRRLARWTEAAAAYRAALARATNEPERRFLARRVVEADDQARSRPK